MTNTGCRACSEAIAGMSPMVVHTCRGAVQPDGAPQEIADTLHWLRGELCEIVGLTVGDDQYPWVEILTRLKVQPDGAPRYCEDEGCENQPEKHSHPAPSEPQADAAHASGLHYALSVLADGYPLEEAVALIRSRYEQFIARSSRPSEPGK